jgi:hypothetical protein
LVALATLAAIYRTTTWSGLSDVVIAERLGRSEAVAKLVGVS